MASPWAYNAFISYSHARDAALARALQTGIEGFAKPWYRMRAARVFRDTANLAVNPDLWQSIQDALAAAEWLIVLVSADSAGSVWVNREVEWWLANRSPARLLVVATSPGLAWDDRAGDWAPGATVPPALRHAFAREPLWADLSDVRPDGIRPRIDPERLATIAAAIHGVPRDTIIGDHLRAHRRTMRVARTAVTVLATLTVVSILATVTAVGQRDTAQAQERLATSGELAALSAAELGTNLDVANLLAVAAYRTEDTPQTEGALLQADATSPHLVRFLPTGDTVTALAGAADGAAVAAGTTDGRLLSVRLATGSPTAVATGLGSITDVAVSANGNDIVATDGTSAVSWTPGQRPVRLSVAEPVGSVAISPAGGETAVLYGEAAAPASAHVLLRDSRSGAGHTIAVPGPYSNVGFPDDSRLIAMGDTSAQEWSVPDRRLLSKYATPALPAADDAFGSSVNGEYAGYSKYGDIYMWGTRIGKGIAINSVAPGGVVSDLAIASDGATVAVVASGTIDVAQAASGQDLGVEPQMTELTGGGAVTAVSFLGDDELISASGDSLELWNLRQESRMGDETGVSIPDADTAGEPPDLAFSPDSRKLAIVGGFQNSLSIYQAGSRFAMVSSRTSGAIGLPLWRGSELQLLYTDYKGNSFLVNEAGTSGLPLRDIPGGAGIMAASLASREDQLLVVDGLGGVWTYNLSTGKGRLAFPEQNDMKGNLVTPVQADISPDGTGAVITESSPDNVAAPASPKVVYVDVLTGRAHVVGAGGADAAVFAGGELFVQRATGTLEIWNAAATRRLRTLPGSGGYTSTLAVSPSGTLLARLRDDGTASVTDVATGEELATFTLPTPRNSTAVDPWNATTLAFTPDGQDLLTATSGGVMTEWDLSPASLIRSACTAAGRNLTAAEWREYVQSTPPANLSCATGG